MAFPGIGLAIRAISGASRLRGFLNAFGGGEGDTTPNLSVKFGISIDPKQTPRIIDAANKDVAGFVRKAVVSCLQELGQRTPVKTGYAVGNWQVGIGAPPASEVGLRSVGSMLASGAGRLAGYRKANRPVFIANNVEYIGKLNAGSSTQAPAGFVDVAIDAGVARAKNRYGR